MSKTLALIPARAGSKRVPGKNVRSFLGKPLVQWSIEFALSYPGFHRVLVSTDDTAVATVAEVAGAAVPWLRPVELASDTASTLDVALHALDACAADGERYDWLALLQPTSPLRRRQRWDEAFARLSMGGSGAVGVSAVEQHPYWTYLLSDDGRMNACFPGKTGLRSQDLPTAAAVNGALYLVSVEALREQRRFVPAGAFGVLFDDALECIDIDTEADWVAAETLAARAWIPQS